MIVADPNPPPPPRQYGAPSMPGIIEPVIGTGDSTVSAKDAEKLAALEACVRLSARHLFTSVRIRFSNGCAHARKVTHATHTHSRMSRSVESADSNQRSAHAASYGVAASCSSHVGFLERVQLGLVGVVRPILDSIASPLSLCGIDLGSGPGRDSARRCQRWQERDAFERTTHRPRRGEVVHGLLLQVVLSESTLLPFVC